MNRPDKIRILSTDFKIRWMTPEEENDHGKFGFFNAVTNTIALSAASPKTQMADTFLHEVVHAIFFMTILGEVATLTSDTHKLNEIISGTLSTAMQCVIRDNPDVVEWYLDLLLDNKIDNQQRMKEILYGKQ